MKLQTIGYPAHVALPVFNSADVYLRVSLLGSAFVGRQLRIVNATIDIAGDYLQFGMWTSENTGPALDSGTGRSVVIDYSLPPGFWFTAGGRGQRGSSTGAFQYDVEIETGVGTGEFVPLSRSDIDYSVSTRGALYAEEGVEPSPPFEVGIVFERLFGSLVEGQGTGIFDYRTTGYGTGFTETQGLGVIRLQLSGSGEAFQEDDGTVPVTPPKGSVVLSYGLTGDGFVYEPGDGEGTFLFAGSGMGVDMPGLGGGITLYTLSAFEAPVFEAYGFFTEPVPIMVGYGGVQFLDLREEFVVADADPHATLLYTLVERFRVQARATPLLRFVALLDDSVVVRDFVSLVFERILTSPVALADAGTVEWVVTVADALMVADARLSLLDALLTVSTALVARDAVTPILQRDVDEVLELVEAQSAQILALVEAASTLVMGDELTNTLLMFGELSDVFDLRGSTPGALLALLTEVMDSVDVGLRVRIGDDLYVGYVVNTRNAAVSQYENFPFSSFAIVGGRAYGSGPDGIYRLGGDTDDGEPIQALVRTGIINFEELVHVPTGWIGLTTSGQMILKTVTMDKGRKKENWYRMKERPQGAPVESRFDVDKGLTGTYWQWELENVDGAYFEFDMLKVWPVRIGRRYSGR